MSPLPSISVAPRRREFDSERELAADPTAEPVAIRGRTP